MLAPPAFPLRSGYSIPSLPSTDTLENMVLRLVIEVIGSLRSYLTPACGRGRVDHLIASHIFIKGAVGLFQVFGAMPSHVSQIEVDFTATSFFPAAPTDPVTGAIIYCWRMLRVQREHETGGLPDAGALDSLTRRRHGESV